MEEIAVVLKRFGDEQSTLLDQFERLSFEVQLNHAILGRSMSEPGVCGSRFRAPPQNGVAPPPLVMTQVKQGRRRRRGRLDKLFKKLLKPVLGRKTSCGGGSGDDGTVVKKETAADPKDLKNWKAFSRSLRI